MSIKEAQTLRDAFVHGMAHALFHENIRRNLYTDLRELAEVFLDFLQERGLQLDLVLKEILVSKGSNAVYESMLCGQCLVSSVFYDRTGRSLSLGYFVKTTKQRVPYISNEEIALWVEDDLDSIESLRGDDIYWIE